MEVIENTYIPVYICFQSDYICLLSIQENYTSSNNNLHAL